MEIKRRRTLEWSRCGKQGNILRNSRPLWFNSCTSYFWVTACALPSCHLVQTREYWLCLKIKLIGADGEIKEEISYGWKRVTMWRNRKPKTINLRPKKKKIEKHLKRLKTRGTTPIVNRAHAQNTQHHNKQNHKETRVTNKEAHKPKQQFLLLPSLQNLILK